MSGSLKSLGLEKVEYKRAEHSEEDTVQFMVRSLPPWLHGILMCIRGAIYRAIHTPSLKPDPRVEGFRSLANRYCVCTCIQELYQMVSLVATKFRLPILLTRYAMIRGSNYSLIGAKRL